MPSTNTAARTIFNQERFARCALDFVLCLLFALAIVLQNPTAALAETVTARAKSSQPDFGQLPENQRLRILIAMVQSGKADQAERLLQAYPLTGKHATNRTLFLNGIIAKVRKNYNAAITNFRKALANDPKLTMVRAELAHTLFITKQDDGAKHHFKLLAAAAPNPELSKKFDDFIDAVDARRPWKLSTYLAMAPSTNYTFGTTRRFTNSGLEIAGNSRQKSGIGITGGANASYTFHPGKDLSLVVAAGLNFRQYDGKTFDDLIASQNVSVVRKHKSGQVAIGASMSERRAGKDETILEGGPYIAITHNISNKVSFFTKLRHLRTDFKIADYRNGGTTTIDNRLTNALSSDLVFYLLSGAQRTTTKRKHLDFWAAYGGLGVYKEFPAGITVYAQGKLTRKLYDGDFPGLTEPQKDTRLDFLASFTKRDFELFGLAPRFDYVYSKSMSNSIFSQYSTHGANFSFTKAF